MSERRLSEIACVLKQPTGITSSDFPRVNRAALKAGIHYDLWQQGLLFLLFARGADGKYACGEGGTVVSSCRQIGKTFTLGTAIFIKCILQPGLKVIWTAHHTRTSDETFNDLCDLAKNKLFARYVERIRRANGQQEISFRNNSRIMFGARENGFGRGLHSVDVEIFDEAQILTVRALDNMLPVVNTSPDPLVVFLGNPPKPGDQCEVFEEKRRAALAGTDGMVYVELAADRDADPDDREQWAKANPSYPKRTSETAILRMRNLMTTDSFRREALGVWDESSASMAIDPARWAANVMQTPPPEHSVLNFGLDMPPDRGVLTIGCAIRYPDGHALIQMADIKDARHDGVMWAVEWLSAKWPRTASVVIDKQSPAMSLLPELQKAHIRPITTSMQEMGRACGRFQDMLKDGTLIHLPDDQQPQLASAVKAATTRPLGPVGAFAWNKLGTDADISPLVACTLALYGAYTTKRDPNRKQEVMIG